MKKISILTALLVIFTMAFTSCKEDTQPRLEYPTEFVLNRPPLADQLILVEAGGSIEFSVSQANYGLATTPTYQIQVSLTEDFAEYRTVDYSTTNAQLTVPAEPFAIAVCELTGWQDPAEVEAVPVYVRCTSTVPNAAPEYNITSNVVKLDQVKVYFAVKLPDAIYVIGQCSGWDINNDAMALWETEPGSLIYKGTITVPAGEFQFRFYDQLGNWDWFSIGSQDDDAPINITFTDGQFTGACFYDPATEKAGKGSWQDTTWPGGDLEITLNLNSKTVVFQQM